MNCSISYLEDEKIIMIKAEGRFDFNEFLLKTREAVVLSVHHESSLVLVDCSLIKSANTNVAKIFNIPEEYEKNEVPRSYKIGLVESKDPDANKNVIFYETVCRNRGWLAQVLPDLDSAKRWLLS